MHSAKTHEKTRGDGESPPPKRRRPPSGSPAGWRSVEALTQQSDKLNATQGTKLGYDQLLAAEEAEPGGSAASRQPAPNIGALDAPPRRVKEAKPKPAPRSKGGILERPRFAREDTARLDEAQQAYGQPGAKTIGRERVALLDERVGQGRAERVTASSLSERPEGTRVITYCSYCLQWFSATEMDSDHVVTWEALGQWLMRIAARLNSEGDDFYAALAEQFQSVGLEVTDFFDFGEGHWDVSKRGTELLFNNVRNLALSCKGCNQQDRNDEQFHSFLGRQIHFGVPFLEWLERQGGLRSHEIATPDGRYAGDLIRLWTQITPYVQRAIENFRLIKLKSHLESERVRRETRATLEGRLQDARGAAEKQELHHRLHAAIEAHYDSEGEEESAQLLVQLPALLQEAKELIQRGVRVRPRQDLEDMDTLAELVERLSAEKRQLLQLNERLQDALEWAEADTDRRIGELQESMTLLDTAMERTETQRRRAEEAERREALLLRENERLQRQNESLRRALETMRPEDVP